MAVQNRTDVNNVPFIRFGIAALLQAAIIMQDAGRVAALVYATVMAVISATIPSTMTADGGNTGDGTVTAVAAGAGASPIVGSWELENTLAVADGGVWKLTDPNGNIVATEMIMTVGAGLATIFNAGGMVFSITDGATNFALADLFTIAITANGDWVPFDATAVNGAQVPKGIYMGPDIAAADIVAGDIAANMVLVGSGVFVDENQVVLEGGATLDTLIGGDLTVREALRLTGIVAEDTVDISSFEN